MSDKLPRHLTEAQAREYAKESETLLEFQRNCRIGRTEAKQLLYQLGMRDDVAQCSTAFAEQGGD